MDRIKVRGGRPLQGSIPISGAKNAALPLMTASLLTSGTLELVNVPRLADVALLLRILENHGVDHSVAGKRPGQTTETGQTIRLDASAVIDTTAPYELVSRMRASFWVIAPLIARFGEARVSMPGGCAIGTRPVDLLLAALERFGVRIEVDGGYVKAKAPHGLKGAEIVFPKVTVSGTHVALMAATLADGVTTIDNAAREPEVVDLADCLNAMGARVTGAGTSRIVIEGVTSLHGATHAVMPDRIETGTYAMAGRDDGRRRPAREYAARTSQKRPRRPVASGRAARRHGRRAARAPQRRRAVCRGCHDRSVPGVPDRSPGPVHGLDDARKGYVADPRNDLREPVHARAGTRAARRPDQA
jgi:UDP-N-acetylglucosamine 1-carboxyvinyltransferase